MIGDRGRPSDRSAARRGETGIPSCHIKRGNEFLARGGGVDAGSRTGSSREADDWAYRAVA